MKRQRMQAPTVAPPPSKQSTQRMANHDELSKKLGGARLLGVTPANSRNTGLLRWSAADGSRREEEEQEES